MADHERAAVYTYSGKSPSATETDATEQTSGFFKLSAELRNMIYHDLVRRGSTYWITADQNKTYGDKRASIAASSAITQVCRQICTETLPIFYGANTFSITLMCETNVTRAKQWVAAVGNTGVEHVKRILLRGRLAKSVRQNFDPKNSTSSICIRVSRRNGEVVVDYENGKPLLSGLPAAGPADELKACIELADDRKPLSSMKEMTELLECFATRLPFRGRQSWSAYCSTQEVEKWLSAAKVK